MQKRTNSTLPLGLIQWSVIKKIELKEKDLSRVDVKLRSYFLWLLKST